MSKQKHFDNEHSRNSTVAHSEDSGSTNTEVVTQHEEKTTSIGTKLIFVLITCVLSLLPLLAVNGVLSLRDNYAAGIIYSLEKSLGGKQEFFGPIIVVPTRYGQEKLNDVEAGRVSRETLPPLPNAFFVPQSMALDVSLSAERYKRSLYYAIGYKAEIGLDADFASISDIATDFDEVRRGDLELDWDQAQLVFMLTDTASAKFRPQVKIGETVVPLTPGLPATMANLRTNGRGNNNGQGFSAPFAGLFAPDQNFNLTTEIAFDGAASMRIAPIASDTTTVNMSASMAPTGLKRFSADFDPTYKPVKGEPYENSWSAAGPYQAGLTPAFARDVSSSLLARQFFAVEYDAENIRPYAEIKRALRYGFFLMGFSFLTFFVFDALSGRYIHSAQYFLLGLIHTVFYALLLGVSEFTGFDRGFFIAAVPAVVVTGVALASILRSIGMGVMVLIIFGAFYSVQYILMDMAEYSLLVAAGAAFLAIAASLLATARLNWGRFSKGGA